VCTHSFSTPVELTFVALAGLLLSSQFNINYFAISEVDQWFGDFSDVWTQAGRAYERISCRK